MVLRHGAGGWRARSSIVLVALLAAAALALIGAGSAHAAAPQPTCPEGTATEYNPDTGLCEAPASPDCSGSFGYVEETGMCETYATPACYNGRVREADGMCVYLSRCHAPGVYDPVLETCFYDGRPGGPVVCEQGGSQVGDSAYCAKEPAPPCREGHTVVRYDDGRVMCQFEPGWTCADHPATTLDAERRVCTVAAIPPPMPTSTDECKDGGWAAYGVFKNQGDCVSFVATQGRNAPAGAS